jgi:hypothetical protein
VVVVGRMLARRHAEPEQVIELPAGNPPQAKQEVA